MLYMFPIIWAMCGRIEKKHHIAHQSASTSGKDTNESATVPVQRTGFCTGIIVLFFLNAILSCLQSTSFKCVSLYPHSCVCLYIRIQMCVSMYPPSHMYPLPPHRYPPSSIGFNRDTGRPGTLVANPHTPPRRITQLPPPPPPPYEVVEGVATEGPMCRPDSRGGERK